MLNKEFDPKNPGIFIHFRHRLIYITFKFKKPFGRCMSDAPTMSVVRVEPQPSLSFRRQMGWAR